MLLLLRDVLQGPLCIGVFDEINAFSSESVGRNSGLDSGGAMNGSVYASPFHKQTALDFIEGRQYLEIAIAAFLADCKARNLSPNTIGFYQAYLASFAHYAQAQSLTNVRDIDPDFVRSYILMYSEGHNPGGVHAAYRSIRAFLFWIEKEEMMPADWKNPIKRVDAPKVPDRIIEPVSLDDVNLLLATCKGNNFFDKRDKALLFFLLDSGARAQEVCDVNLDDVELNTGKVLIREGKGRKSRFVFINRTTVKALRAYLRLREDLQTPALFASKTMERLTYDGLRQLIQRRSKLAGLKNEPTLHDFRRQFALSMLNNGVDIYSLQRLMGHNDVTVLRRYLALTTEDIRVAHDKGSPVENYTWS
jgi:integrase/recombinase XerD